MCSRASSRDASEVLRDIERMCEQMGTEEPRFAGIGDACARLKRSRDALTSRTRQRIGDGVRDPEPG